MIDFEYSFIFIYTTLNGIEDIIGIIIFQINTVFFDYFKAVIVDIGNLIVGKYFEINGTKNDVNRLISTIKNIEGELRDTRSMDVSTNKYYYFLGLALILILLDVLIKINVIRI